MPFTRLFVASAVAASMLSVAAASDDSPQVMRAKLMEEIGDSMKPLGPMMKGEKPYDAAVVEGSMDVLIENGEEFPKYFPEGSETGHDTKALPAIWENKTDFDEKAMAMVTAAKAARDAAADGKEVFGPKLGALGKTCRACHTDYRAKDN